MAYAQTYTNKIENQTITVIVKPNNTIIIEPQNNTKLEKLIQALVDKPEVQWHQGDIIIASSTIVAFFGFGSFLIIRFKSRGKKKLAGYLDVVLIATWTIETMHLFTIAAIVNNTFQNIKYPDIIFVTVFLLAIILLFIRKIIHAENNLDKIQEEKDNTKKDFLDYVGEKYHIGADDLQKTLDEFKISSIKKGNNTNNPKSESIEDDDL